LSVPLFISVAIPVTGDPRQQEATFVFLWINASPAFVPVSFTIPAGSTTLHFCGDD